VGCLRRLVQFVFTLIVVVLLLAAGGYYLLLQTMHTELADALRRKFMLPPSSVVTIEPGDIMDTLNGEVDSIHLSSPEASISGIRVENVEFEAEHLSFDILNLVTRKNPVLKEVDYAAVSFAIRPEDLAAAWAERAGRFGVSDLEVKFKDAEGDELPLVEVTARTELLGREFELRVNGYFKLIDRREIAFRVNDFDLGMLSIGRDLLESVFVRLAPRLEIGDMQGDLYIDDFYVEDGKLHVQAHTKGVAVLEEGTQPKPEE
jgi:hypothetical protein